MKRVDVAVIGAGVFGAWTARALWRAGRSVILVEARSPGNSLSSSGGESRIIRMGYGADEIYTAWSAQSLTEWRDLSARSTPPLFHQCGVLWLGRDDDPIVDATRACLARVGIPHEPLSREALTGRYPQMRFDGIAFGILEPESGVLMARRAVQQVVREAIETGVEYRQMRVDGGTSCASIRIDGVEAAHYVYACGAWLPSLFPDVVGPRLFPTRQEVFFFAAPGGDDRFGPTRMPAWIDFPGGVYGLPDLEGRGVKMAIDRHGPPIDPDIDDRIVSPGAVDAIRQVMASRMPALAGAPLVEARVCQYENSTDGHFIIDRHPAHENVWIVGGGSGHGFKHGPAVGDYVARLLDGGPPEPRFSLMAKGTRHHRSVF